MKIGKEELLDKFRRATEMEEVMASILTDLVAPHVLQSEIPEAKRQKIHHMISIIHADTLRHQQIVSGILGRLSSK